MKAISVTGLNIPLILVLTLLLTRTDAQPGTHFIRKNEAGIQVKNKKNARCGFTASHGLISDLKFNKQHSFRPGNEFAVNGFYQPAYRWQNGYGTVENHDLDCFIDDTPVNFNFYNGWYVAAGPASGILFSAIYVIDERNQIGEKRARNKLNCGIYAGAGYQFRNGLSVNVNPGYGRQPLASQIYYVGYSGRNICSKNMVLKTGFYYLANQHSGSGIDQKENDLNTIAGMITDMLISLYISSLK